MTWCNSECSDAWYAADPKRGEGWVSFDGLTNERIAELLGEIGLGCVGVGKQRSS